VRKLLLFGLALLLTGTCAALSIPLLLVGGAQGACTTETATADHALDVGRSIVVGASVYGGPGDPTSGTSGYRGDKLTGTTSFAELSENPAQLDFAALGDLPRGARLRITVTVDGRTRSIVASKLDVGGGGPDVQGHPRAVDLWWETANQLGLPGTSGQWTGLVRIQRTRATATQPSAEETCAAPISGGPLTERIVQIARAELAKRISEPGNNCVPYNNCDGQPWCASFISYVWSRSGVPMPYTAASNTIWTWASQHTQVLGPDAQPQPGDAILYGTGPASTTTSVHVGLVETVLPDGRITTIEGNLSDRIVRQEPFRPQDAVAAGEPAAVYAYARPR
jgi:hypothetical protein